MKHTRIVPSAERIERYQNELSAVTVTSEAAIWYEVDVSTVILWCNEGKVFATQPEGSTTWIISVRSLFDSKGIPPYIEQMRRQNSQN